MRLTRFKLLSLVLAVPLAGLVIAGIEGLLVLCDVAPRRPPVPIELRAKASAQQTVRWDRDLLYRYAANADILGFYRTNSLGYRGGEFESMAPAGRMRILCLGDSCTFGLGLSERDTFVARLEHALDAAFQGVLDVEVLNLGVIGYSTYQTRRQLEIDGAALKPDIVILMPTAFNDATAAPQRTDRERAADNLSWITHLKQLRLARVLGAADPVYEVPKQIELAAATKQRSRVSVTERREELEACFAAAERIRTRLLPVRFGCAESAASLDPEFRDRSASVLEFATAHSLFCVDVESEFASFAPLELYTDGVHPSRLGARVIANAVFHALLRSGWFPDSPRARFLRNWSLASRDGWDLAVAPSEEELREGAPTVFAEALASLDSEKLDTANPADPLSAVGRGDYPAGWLVLSGDRDSTLARNRYLEIENNVRPRDSLLRFLGIRSFHQPLPTSRTIRFARAGVVFERSLSIAPPAIDRRIGEVAAAVRRRELVAARPLLEKVLVLAPNQPDALVLRARIARMDGERRAAQVALERALLVDPDHAEALSELATLALDAMDLVRAEPLLGRALANDPFALDCRYARARLMIAKGEIAAARAELELLLAINPAAVPEAAPLLEKLGPNSTEASSRAPPSGR